MGRVLEAKGKTDEAREMRMKGNTTNRRIMCGSDGVRYLHPQLCSLCVADHEIERPVRHAGWGHARGQRLSEV